MKKVISSMILSLLMIAPALCETSIWIVKTDSSAIYIGGVIHLLRESDQPIPPEFDKAYNTSEILVLETDYDKMEGPEFQQALMANAVYTDGRTLDSVISSETYKKLDEFCTKNGLSLISMNQYKPSTIMVVLTTTEMQKLGVNQKGLDVYYHNKAKADKKSIAKLETIDKQIKTITSMGEGNESAFIQYSINEIDKIKVLFDELVKAWKTGNEIVLYELFLKELKKDFPKLFKAMFTDRNNNWMPQVEKYLITPETELMLVGVGHLLGQEGVIAQLKKRGYEVEKFK